MSTTWKMIWKNWFVWEVEACGEIRSTSHAVFMSYSSFLLYLLWKKFLHHPNFFFHKRTSHYLSQLISKLSYKSIIFAIIFHFVVKHSLKKTKRIINSKTLKTDINKKIFKQEFDFFIWSNTITYINLFIFNNSCILQKNNYYVSYCKHASYLESDSASSFN